MEPGQAHAGRLATHRLDEALGVVRLHTRSWLYLLVASLALDGVLFVLETVEEISQGRENGVEVALQLAAYAATALALLALTRCLGRSQRRIHHDSEVLAATAVTTADWLWETDASFRFTYSSPGVQPLLGYPPSEIVGTSILDGLVADVDLPDRAADLERALGSESGWADQEAAWQHQDGSAVVLRSWAAPIHDEHGRLEGYRGTRRLAERSVSAGASVSARRRIAAVVSTRAVDTALQPIVSLGSGRMVGVEALSRFRDGRGPDAWFEDARMAGSTITLDRFTFCTALGRLHQLPPDVYLSVNASPELIMHRDFGDLLAEEPTLLSRLVVEITEHKRIVDYAVVNRALAPLRAQGMRLAVDDAGAGYASMTHILRLRPDIIKLDRSMVSDLRTDRAQRSLVTALVLMAFDIGASVTGEGVETHEQLDTLGLLSVDAAQGYGLGRPSLDPCDWQYWTAKDWACSTPESSYPSW